MDDPSQLLISDTVCVRHAMATIDRAGKGIALVVDDDQRLMATVTDGDLRRSILAGVAVDDPVSVVLASKPAERQTPVCGGPDMSDLDLIELMDRHELRHIPVVDHDGRVVRLVVREEVGSSGPLAIAAVVLADQIDSGDASTEHLRQTLDHLRQSDLTEIHVLASDRSEWARGAAMCADVRFTQVQGSGGIRSQLTQLPASRLPWLVIDGAMHTRVNLPQMLHFHRDHDATVTMGVRRYDFKVPYGVIRTEGSYIRSLHEKPKYQFVVNEGIYIVEPTLTGRMDRSCQTMADVVNQLLPSGETVATFPIVEYWFDIADINEPATKQTQKQSGSIKWAA